MAKAKTDITMKQDKVCKGSIRYKATDSEAAVLNVYVNKTFADPMPEEITVTISST